MQTLIIQKVKQKEKEQLLFQYVGSERLVQPEKELFQKERTIYTFFNSKYGITIQLQGDEIDDQMKRAMFLDNFYFYLPE